jgi:hypothetical protein
MWQKGQWFRLAMYVALILTALAILASPFIIPLLATRPLPPDKLIHGQR